MINLLDFKAEELSEKLAVPKFRGKQVYDWLKKGVTDFDFMHNLPADFRLRLSERYTAKVFEELGRLESKDGTIKILGKFLDSATVEAVLMKYRYGYSACISTQVGCRMGCEFCASAKGGFVRHLSVGELLGEVYRMTQIAGEKLSNLVLMGMGEPLDNYDHVISFLRRVTDEMYYGLSARSITVSTCGLVEGIKKLASEEIPVTLALSLHNPFQAEREKIMPIARKYKIDDIMSATQYYFEKTGRRITLEYALIHGENDSTEHAEELIRLIRDRSASAYHVNLIPLNNHEYTEHKSAHQKDVARFKQKLDQHGINATIRRELGSDIDAACGQLKNNWRNYG
ncbi:MAG: 23S rRNA (adenine(2503)-C(2))-methyltransferase RlmN [Bacillota bacterium]|nr:23S rRNA (adenine(2503)-C(2))-methyltransferase RlmN [Bacillota bacterium]